MTTDGTAGVSDLDLLALTRDGSTEAYVALFGRHHDAALDVARELGAAAPDDLVAETFVRILGRIDNGEGPQRTFATYLACVLHRTHAELAPSAGSDAGMGRASSASADSPVAPDATSLPEISVLDPDDPRAAASPLATAFAALTPAAQVALWLREVDEVPSVEAAELTSSSVAVVDRLALRAREALAPHHSGGGPLVAALVATLEPITPPKLTLVPGVASVPGSDAPTEDTAGAPAAVPVALAAVPTTAAAASPSETPSETPPAATVWPTWVRARLLPGLTAAGVVAATVALVMTVVWRAPGDNQALEASPHAPTLEVNPQAPGLGALNGGRVAPALLGGMVSASVRAVDSVEEAATDEPTSAEPTPADEATDDTTTDDTSNETAVDPTSESTSGDPTPTPTPTGGDGDGGGGGEPHNPPTVTAGSPSLVDADSRTWRVTFQIGNVTAGSVANLSVTEGSEIVAVSGGWQCGSGTRTLTCEAASGGAETMTVTVRAPAGGTLTVTVPRSNDGSASDSVSFEQMSGGAAVPDESDPAPDDATDD